MKQIFAKHVVNKRLVFRLQKQKPQQKQKRYTLNSEKGNKQHTEQNLLENGLMTC